MSTATPTREEEKESTTADGDDDDQEEWLIFCRCEKAKAVYTLLDCLRNVGAWGTSAARRDHLSSTQSRRPPATTGSNSIQPVTVFCYPGSLTFHVMGKSKQVQASVSMQAGLFSQYNLCVPPHNEQSPEGDEEKSQQDWHSEGEFCVNLSTVLQCLSLLGTQSLERMKVSLSYNLTQEVFKVELTDDAGVLTTAAIPGMQLSPEEDMGQSLALAMRSSPVAARIIIKSDTLREILIELESVGGAKVGTVSLDAQGLEIAVVGDLSECLVSIPCRGSHVVSLECPSSSGKAYSFPLHSLLGSLRGLEIAEETCITINDNGMVAIQHQVLDKTTGDGSPNFVDFIMCSLEEEDNEEPMAESQEMASQQHNTQQYTQDSYSQSLATRAMSQNDEQSRGASVSIRDTDFDDEEEDEQLEAGMDASLFGSVLGTGANDHRATDLSHRTTRRRVQPTRGHESDESRDLLASDDDEEELRALDVRARRDTRHEVDRGNTSSPELVHD